MTCGTCQTENRPDRKFCLRCGARLDAGCPNCGATNEPEAAYCGECGTRLTAPAVTREAGTVASAPLVERPIAERRLVSVLFADLVGYTSLAEGMDAEDARELLALYYESAREIVRRYGGVVEKFIGDAVMAAWGTPTAHEDDAERAVRAGLDLVATIPGLADGRLQVRAGVMTGEAAVQLGAAGQGMVAGDLVNTASRLQGAAEPGTVLVGEATWRAASGAVAFEPAGEQALRGRIAPVPAWRAIGLVGRVGGAGRVAGVEPPFVGRDAEFAALRERFHATARDRRARLVSIVGVAGIGKSRLAWELEKYLDGLVEPVYWHHGRSPAYGDGLAFWALGEMVRRRAGIAERDDPTATAAKLEATLAEYVPDEEERRWLAQRIRPLIGLADEAERTREELFAAWRRLFEAIGARGTAVLVFEDLQWADAGLVAFIESLMEWSAGHPLLIVTLARPELLERHPSWGAGQREFTSIHLRPLDETAMHAIVEGVAPGLPSETAAAIVARAEGVPLYAVELFRMLVDRRVVELVGDRYQPTGDGLELAIPETLQSLIAARLDALPEGDRRLVQDASILGKTFTTASLAAISGEPAAELEPRLRGLARRELLTLDADPRSPERGQYGFTGALVREVAYGTLARRERRARHLAAARHFEALGDDELAGILAAHYVAAHAASQPGPEADAVAAQARIALQAAADRALAVASPDAAVSYLQQALTVTGEPAERTRIQLALASAARRAGNWPVVSEAASAALAQAEAMADPVAIARASATLGQFLFFAGRAAEATIVMTRALERLGDRDAHADVELRGLLARSEMFLSQPLKALEWCESGLVAAARIDHVRAIADLILTRAWACSALGRWREAIAGNYGALRLAEENDATPEVFRAVNNLAAMLIDFAPQEALALLRRGRALAEQHGDRDWLDKLAFAAWISVFVGDWDAADEMLARHLRPGLLFGHWNILADARAMMAAWRGLDDEADALLAEVRERRVEVAQVDERYASYAAEAYVAAARDDAEAGRLALAGMRAHGDQVGWNEILALEGLLAARAGDVPAIEAAATALAGLPLQFELVVSSRRVLEAAAAARRGRAREAGPMYTEATESLARVGNLVLAILGELDAVGALPPDDPAARRAAEHIRSFVQATGATAIAARLEDRLAEARVAQALPAPSAGQPAAAVPQNVRTTS